jgi:hypothetical protein
MAHAPVHRPRQPSRPNRAAFRSQTQLAAAALRDKVLGPKLQRAREALVPHKLSEPAFWDHFFSHVDVTKVGRLASRAGG